MSKQLLWKSGIFTQITKQGCVHHGPVYFAIDNNSVYVKKTLIGEPRLFLISECIFSTDHDL